MTFGSSNMTFDIKCFPQKVSINIWSRKAANLSVSLPCGGLCPPAARDASRPGSPQSSLSASQLNCCSHPAALCPTTLQLLTYRLGTPVLHHKCIVHMQSIAEYLVSVQMVGQAQIRMLHWWNVVAMLENCIAKGLRREGG